MRAPLVTSSVCPLRRCTTGTHSSRTFLPTTWCRGPTRCGRVGSTKVGGHRPATQGDQPMKIREQLSWQKEAAGASPDVYSEVFFLNDPESDAEALAICSSCPVRTQCLDANFGVPDGVFGGTTAAERRAMGGGRDVFRLNLNFSNRGRVVDEGVPD